MLLSLYRTDFDLSEENEFTLKYLPGTYIDNK
jgi:hypothetical protein